MGWEFCTFPLSEIHLTTSLAEGAIIWRAARCRCPSDGRRYCEYAIGWSQPGIVVAGGCGVTVPIRVVEWRAVVPIILAVDTSTLIGCRQANPK